MINYIYTYTWLLTFSRMGMAKYNISCRSHVPRTPGFCRFPGPRSNSFYAFGLWVSNAEAQCRWGDKSMRRTMTMII